MTEQQIIILICSITVGVALFAIASVLVISYICFYRIFSARRGKQKKDGVSEKVARNYAEFHGKMREFRNEVETLPYSEAKIISFDGLTLRGRFYEYKKGAPIEIMMHGYRGSRARDMGAGVIRSFRQGRSALCIDHRGCGESEGSVITFGINESRDCAAWVDYIINNIDKDAKIIMSGVSLGASTALIAAGRELPRNVVGVVADCGYTTAREIIMKTIKDMRLPPRLIYPFARLGGKIYGGFDIDETSPLEMMEKTRLPIVFIHGDADSFTPHEMSIQNFNACASEKKKLVLIEGAEHGVAFLADEEGYLGALTEFFEPIVNIENK